MCFFFVAFIWLCELVHLLGGHSKPHVTVLLNGKSQLENNFLNFDCLRIDQ